MKDITETYYQLKEVDGYLKDWESREHLDPEGALFHVKDYKEQKWMLLNKLCEECETEMSKIK